MDGDHLRNLLEQVQSGNMDLDSAMQRLKKLPFDDLGYAKIDYHRCIRQGVPEVIFCQGKTIAQIQGIVKHMARHHSNILASRANNEVYEGIQEVAEDCLYHEMARMVVINPRDSEKVGNIAVVSAGTSDIPVAEEAAVTAETLGHKVNRFYDVGVAGIHRLLNCCEELFQAHAVIVVAGMEGALASVVGGLVSSPVIGVPTSVGYGASFGGVAALLSMLNSCASGVSVVNIDNGFGAGYQAGLINMKAVKRSSGQSVHGPVKKQSKPRLAEVCV
ncbi:MAG: nickel pincer cofactor biosynthesis protein LarB [Desulfomonile tiedjei]|uniref:Nickel pincer cofactor biosynthesis protein LarB n=1 Tax=Desulfomonile tiedjei TaxID=2358 RepID=A0A9D6Z269_9BACT|nr:nickel pincer cofactor biosynthesis protein LarB [Desulfomonile tiedjei]